MLWINAPNGDSVTGYARWNGLAVVNGCEEDEGQGDLQMDANARLIAAAPDLYAAIREYLDWGAMTGSDRDYFDRKFRAALQKADGAQ